MKRSLAALALFLASVTPAVAEIVKVPAKAGVAETADALEAAVTGAGLTVFARIDHGRGAESVGLSLGDSQLLVFGSPKAGTPAMQAEPLAGLVLPLRVLVYEDGAGAVWLAYEAPADMLGALGIPAEAPYVKGMTGALDKLTGAAAGG
ncbi:uncharacterized protein Ga0609869_000423 [Rhodovulum iodosum]|uniref:DUF302 domain-containing protein n=1 Tax=Rhodovulum iodosum TaxID=68291 RepID=A0ABV3XP34_9RHOB|nr:DUF302 domain-containing protein [Rhodovulum robiginosum]RSK38011.1 DUF302 domain-containing protein [Rhodovulum robiginosum]